MTEDERVEAVADALMDARVDWPWSQPPSDLTYQESMRKLARLVLQALDQQPMRRLYARLAAEHEKMPTVPDHGGGVPGDRFDL